MTDWLSRRSRSKRTSFELYCFPHAGGGSSIYHRWERILPERVLVSPIKLPGREARFKESPIDNVDEMLLCLEEQVLPVVTPPLVIFGHSMGGLIAYEWTCSLIDAGIQPSLLVVSASRSPDGYQGEGRLHKLPDDEMIASLQRDFGRGRPFSDDETEMMKMLADTIRADLKLLETHRWSERAPIDVPIVAMYGTEDSEIPKSRMEGWKARTTAAFELHAIEGHHFYLPEREDEVTKIIMDSL
ncbi:MAG: alpha/beta fold hydrolase [Planctomycetota bacterium]